MPIEIKAEIKITVYGDGPYKSELLNKIKHYRLENCFEFMGSKATLNALFCNYDYLLQPTHMECFSLSILESLSANVPVITTNVGGNEEVVTHGENGYIFTAKDSVALSALIQDVYLGRKKITNNTRELIINSFSLAQMVENHLQLVLH